MSHTRTKGRRNECSECQLEPQLSLISKHQWPLSIKMFKCASRPQAKGLTKIVPKSPVAQKIPYKLGSKSTCAHGCTIPNNITRWRSCLIGSDDCTYNSANLAGPIDWLIDSQSYQEAALRAPASAELRVK